MTPALPSNRVCLYPIRAIQTISRAAHIGSVDQQASFTKEITMNNTIVNGIRSLTIGAVISLGFTAVTASAAGLNVDQPVGDGVNKYLVRYPDLDLSKMEGATALYSRISHAARIVCQPLESRQMDIATKHSACLQQAVAKAVADVNSPLVSQYHELRTKGDKASQVRLAQAN
jgi:UrcA family protein